MSTIIPKPKRRFVKGFTLAELLIAVAILGVIATFTIPAIITTQQNSQFNSAAKEDIAALTAAYQQAQMAGIVSSSFAAINLTPYLNYVSVDTSSTIDALPTNLSQNCSASYPCLVMHNGSKMQFWPATTTFGGTANNNSVYLFIDPDGILTTNTTNGPGKSVEVHLFYNGRPATRGTLPFTAVSSDFARSLNTSVEPSWFSW